MTSNRFQPYFNIIIIIVFIFSSLGFVFGRNKNNFSSVKITPMAENDSVTIDIGTLHNFVSNNTVDFANNIDWQTFFIGRDDYNAPSMMWDSDGYSNNHYLFSGAFFVGYNQNTIRFNSATSSDFTVIQNNPSIPAPLKVSYSMTDSLAGPLMVGIKADCNIYAWSDLNSDDFFIYEYFIINTSGVVLEDVYTGLYMDFDVSTAGAGTGQQSFFLDDNVNSYIGVGLNRIPESISYMYDDDNPFIPNNDKGGILNPQESLGFIGSRILHSPATKNGVSTNKQSGHWWWSTGNAPTIGSDYFDLMSSEQFRSQPLNPSDYKYLQSMGPWDISSGDTLKIALAIGIGRRLDGLRENMQRAYNLYWTTFQPQAIPEISFTNPDPGLHIFYWGDSLEFKVDAASIFGDSLTYHWIINDIYNSNNSDSFIWRANITNTGSNFISCEISNGIIAKKIEWIIVVESTRPVQSFRLGQNYPNPFNGITTIPIDIKENVDVLLSVYDITGRKVITLVRQPAFAERYELKWNGKDIKGNDLASGLYFYKLKAGDFTQVRKLMIIR